MRELPRVRFEPQVSARYAESRGELRISALLLQARVERASARG